MLNFEVHSKGSVDAEELAAFTHRAYNILPIPYRYGSTLNEIETVLRKDCPEFIATAREDGALVGWAGVYHWTDSMAYFLSWHPLVIPPDPEISQQLVRQCIAYTASSGRDRMEVFLMNLKDEYRDSAAALGEIYRAVGMVRGYEWAFMEADLTHLNFSIWEIPHTMTIRSLAEVSNDELWPSYDAAFSSGGDRRYENQSEAQRRENFETFFSREVPIDEDASIVLFDRERIVGFVKIDIVKAGAYVHGVGVVPDYRGQGFARFVLGTSLRRAAANNHQKMVLEVDVENQAAMGLYNSLGFKTVKGSISYIWEKVAARDT
ncbi:MAG: GNAT family N-acetyltransferase [Anaerolineae bacterium]|nr:GNAT family N-acetyltransferase [Anaerolineae bacterium]